ncbi:hypothetical protein HanRHA438_Chr17g0804081 [Helianthus annuus]|uniref:Uncharacterized protein n=1 Tax=Helianthus annuus TaxID=4232 RepID=A0A251RNG3_HELAN|nr:hypothetical protein HanXRQr2_Chr17g0793951 [Helianthus annuus]KAJ0825515.1 hypothetical protein HanRHA438_Chr17g0804081 [Helianthus annuus]
MCLPLLQLFKSLKREREPREEKEREGAVTGSPSSHHDDMALLCLSAGDQLPTHHQKTKTVAAQPSDGKWKMYALRGPQNPMMINQLAVIKSCSAHLPGVFKYTKAS